MSASRPPYTLAELSHVEERAKVTLFSKSRGYVEDAKFYADFLVRALPALRNAALALDNLTATQTRCTELKEELRRARFEAKERAADLEGKLAELEALLEAKALP